MSALLRHDPRAAILSNRTINALTRAGLRTFDDLAKEASRKPNVIRGIENLGPTGVREIITALNTARIEHTIRTTGARGSATPRR